MYHLLPLRRGTTFELGNPDTTLARKARDWVSSPTCRNFDLPLSRGGVKADHHRTTRKAHARHGGLHSPSRHHPFDQEPSGTGNSGLLLGVPSMQVSRNQRLARFGLPGVDNNLTPLSYPNAGPDTEAGLLPVGPLECLSPCRRDARGSG